MTDLMEAVTQVPFEMTNMVYCNYAVPMELDVYIITFKWMFKLFANEMDMPYFSTTSQWMFMSDMCMI